MRSSKVSRGDRKQIAERPITPTDRDHSWLVAILLGLGTAIVFWPAIYNGFVNFDDLDYVARNPKVQAGLNLAALGWAFTTGHMSNWHPLTWLSHMVDCRLYGTNPGGHHLTSVLLHSLSTALLFLLLHRITRSAWPSFMVAVIFGLHPTRVESVAWISERKDVLSTLFWILTICVYAKWIQTGNGVQLRWRYWLCLALFALGLLSKPMLVTLPCVLLLLDFWPLGRFSQESPRKLVVEKLPFLALALISSIITIIVQEEAMASIENVSLGARVSNALVAYCRYLAQLFWPSNLSVFYPRRWHWDVIWVLLAALVLVLVSGVAVALRRNRPYLLVGWLWYLGTLVPVIGLVQVGAQSMADRYTYIPTIGLLMMIAWSVNEWIQPSKWRGALWIAVTAVPAMMCAVLTSWQIPIWRDGKTLFLHTIAVTEKHPTPYHNLGTYFLERGEAIKALPYLLETLRLSPHHDNARYNYGLALMNLGRKDDAIEAFREAVVIKPTFSKAQMKLGAALSASGRQQEALGHFAEAVRLDPANAVARQLYAETLVNQKQLDHGIAQFREAIKLEPQSGEGCFRLAQTLQAAGRKEEAIEAWQNGLNLAPNDVTALNNLGSLFAEAGRMEDAAKQFRLALQIDPANADATHNLKLTQAYLEKRK